MTRTSNSARILSTSGGTLCLFDDAGHLVGTVTRPERRDPIGVGRETILLVRPAAERVTAAA
ncbi:MAG: hypothetical protein FJ202_09525 [Gemmatimonadetes bacterium]|nr:hypothetical protein [Gemmatimonadota bacterium]